MVKKVVALTSVSGPYIAARYSGLAHSFPNLDVTLVEFGRTSVTYPWNCIDEDLPYKRIILSDQPAEEQPWFSLIARVIQCLNQLNPETLVIVGYSEVGMLTALLWCIFHRKPAVMLCETKEDDAPRYWYVEEFKKILIRGYKSALVGGKKHKDYLVKLGMEGNSIFQGYDVVENSRFNPGTIKDLPNPVDNKFFLAINRFVPKKNLFNLIQAYSLYVNHSERESWDLVLCGDGLLRPQIEELIHNLELEERIHLPGFLQIDQLLPYFAHSSCFIHASTQEEWGLVVNEAMASGLPVLVSNRCGCFDDLIIEGINGFGFDPDDYHQLSKLMQKISSESVDLVAMGQASLQHIQNYSPTTFACSLMKALQYVT
jgi:1,2-diacylglycerol 3-alpha-glucosyltransferase